MELEQRIVIAAEVARSSQCPSDCVVEHAADCGTIESPCLHGEADDFAGELIHHRQVAGVLLPGGVKMTVAEEANGYAAMSDGLNGGMSKSAGI